MLLVEAGQSDSPWDRCSSKKVVTGVGVAFVVDATNRTTGSIADENAVVDRQRAAHITDTAAQKVPAELPEKVLLFTFTVPLLIRMPPP